MVQNYLGLTYGEPAFCGTHKLLTAQRTRLAMSRRAHRAIGRWQGDMYLYKASGDTYKRVIRQQVHAFPYSPTEARADEFILLSKNRRDCGLLEKQVQFTGKLHSVRLTTADELEAWFPDVDAGERWRYAMQLYWIRRLKSPFNLAEVAGFNAQRYAQVQGFAKLDPTDEIAMLRYLIGTNEDLILNVMNNAERPDASDDE